MGMQRKTKENEQPGANMRDTGRRPTTNRNSMRNAEENQCNVNAKAQTKKKETKRNKIEEKSEDSITTPMFVDDVFCDDEY